jgi:hypothetical protein
MECQTNNSPATLKMAEHVVNLYMHEVAMHVDHNVEEFKPPFTEESIRSTGLEEEETSKPLTSAHIAALSTCLTSIDGVFEAFLSLDIDTIRTLPILYFVRIAYAVVVLIKMFFAAAKPNSELGKVINKGTLQSLAQRNGFHYVEIYDPSPCEDQIWTLQDIIVRV